MNKPPSKQIPGCCICVVNLFLTFVLLFGAILFLGIERRHISQKHPLASIFTAQQHADLLQNISNSPANRILLVGKKEEGSLDFLEHYANLRAKNETHVQLKVLSDDPFANFVEMCQDIKASTMELVGLQDSGETIEWVFLVKRADYYENVIKFIDSKFPNHRVVIGLEDLDPSFPEYQQFIYTPVSSERIRQSIQQATKFDEKRVQILARFYTKVEELMSDFKNTPITLQSLLGGHFKDLSSLSEQDRNTMAAICQDGVFKTKQIITGAMKARFQGLGIFSFRRKAYWLTHKDRLNYELAHNVFCLPEIVPESLYRASYDKEFAQQQRQKLKEYSQKLQQKQSSASRHAKQPKPAAQNKQSEL